MHSFLVQRNTKHNFLFKKIQTPWVVTEHTDCKMIVEGVCAKIYFVYYWPDCAKHLYRRVIFFLTSFLIICKKLIKGSLLEEYVWNTVWKNSFQLRVNFLSPVCLGHYFPEP